ncbi:MAG: transporter substrate-binding domain-containing protein [Micrococcales bacterium]|nr:transporter substrate-binding domain-containing protein [Micrococcales bacterium]
MTATPAAQLAPTGTLRASINLGNAVLAGGTHEEPAGVTVELAREIGRRLGVPVELLTWDAARDSLAAMERGEADLCFLAIDPARAGTVAFTRPYVVIEGVYAVPLASRLASAGDVDAPGVRVGVKQGSAYDLHLTRELAHAEVVRGAEGVEVFAEQGLAAGAGIREPVTAWVAERDDVRLLEPAFMQIRQAIGVPVGTDPAAVAWLDEVVEELRAGGAVADGLELGGQSRDLVAPAGLAGS